jgi:hypothetical protein
MRPLNGAAAQVNGAMRRAGGREMPRPSALSGHAPQFTAENVSDNEQELFRRYGNPI